MVAHQVVHLFGFNSRSRVGSDTDYRWIADQIEVSIHAPV